MNLTLFDWTGLDPRLWVELSSHFMRRGEMTATSGDTIATPVTSGTAAIDTVYPHCLAIGSSTATDNKGHSVQWSPKVLGFYAGKTHEFVAKLFYTTATNGEGCFGVSVVDTTVAVTNGPPVAGLIAEVTDFVGFVKIAQSATLKFRIIRDSALSFDYDVHTLSDLQAVTLEYKIRMHPTIANAGYLTIKVNGAVKCSEIYVTGIPIASEELLCLTAENITSAAAATYAYVDKIGVRMELP